MSQLTKFKLGEGVIYHGKTYAFCGYISAITDDEQYVVTAYYPAGNGMQSFFIGMKHIYGGSQLTRAARFDKPDTAK